MLLAFRYLPLNLTAHKYLFLQVMSLGSRRGLNSYPRPWGDGDHLTVSCQAGKDPTAGLQHTLQTHEQCWSRPTHVMIWRDVGYAAVQSRAKANLELDCPDILLMKRDHMENPVSDT